MRRRLDESELPPAQRLVLERSRAMSMPLTDVARAIGKNQSYIHTFVWNGIPKALPLPVRVALAKVLQVPEDRLRAEGEPSVMEIVGGAEDGSFQPPPGVEKKDLPVYRDDGAINEGRALEWVARPSCVPPGADGYAIWISLSRGRLQAGDLAFVRTNRPPREGDTVVALRGESIAAIGTLVEITADKISITESPGDPKSFPRHEISVGKIVAAFFQ